MPAQPTSADDRPVLLPPQKMRNYYKSVSDHKDVTKLVLMLTSSVNSFREQITAALKGYEKYNFLWEEDRDAVSLCRRSCGFLSLWLGYVLLVLY